MFLWKSTTSCTKEYLPARLWNSQAVPSPHWCVGFFLPECRASHSFLLKFLGFQWLIPSVFCNFSEGKSPLPLRTTLHYSVVLLLMMMIWSGMSSVTRYQLDFKVFSVSILSLMDKELFIHLVIHSAYCCLTTLISVVLLETFTKMLLESR